MPTRRLPDPPDGWRRGDYPCLHPEHNPPSMMVFEPGSYWPSSNPSALNPLILVAVVTALLVGAGFVAFWWQR